MKAIYVAGPFRGASHWEIAENIRNAERLALEVWKRGAVALCPHLNTAHFQDALPDDVWLKGDLELLNRCDAIIMTSDWARSRGAQEEYRHAADLRLPIFFAEDLDGLSRWIAS